MTSDDGGAATNWNHVSGRHMLRHSSQDRSMGGSAQMQESKMNMQVAEEEI